MFAAVDAAAAKFCSWSSHCKMHTAFKSTSAAAGKRRSCIRLLLKMQAARIEQFAANDLKKKSLIFCTCVVYLGDWDTCTRTNTMYMFFLQNCIITRLTNFLYDINASIFSSVLQEKYDGCK